MGELKPVFNEITKGNVQNAKTLIGDTLSSSELYWRVKLSCIFHTCINNNFQTINYFLNILRKYEMYYFFDSLAAASDLYFFYL